MSKKRKIGIVTYVSLHSNFTNYGTVLQAWALSKVIEKMQMNIEPVLVNYCADAMKDKHPLSPIRYMWDKDSSSQRMVAELMPDIESNYKKIESFYHNQFSMTKYSYCSENFEDIICEGISNYIIGSDSIWDKKEFGVDPAFWGDFDCMRGNAFTYAPSFQDSTDLMPEEDLKRLINNFSRISVRESGGVVRLKKLCSSPIYHVLDPTLLLEAEDYRSIISEKLVPQEPYMLFYSRRYDRDMEQYVYELAKEENLKVVEISIRTDNRDKCIHHYDAGVEEFLGLIANAEKIVTNSYHCICFSIIFGRSFYCRTREHCEDKIIDLLCRFGLSDRIVPNGAPPLRDLILDYTKIYKRLKGRQEESISYLKSSLEVI